MADRRSGSDSDSESSEEPINLQDGADGWDDVEDDDEEGIEVVSFFGQDDGVFKSAESMIEQCSKKHGLDFAGAVQNFGAFTLRG